MVKALNLEKEEIVKTLSRLREESELACREYIGSLPPTRLSKVY